MTDSQECQTHLYAHAGQQVGDLEKSRLRLECEKHQYVTEIKSNHTAYSSRKG